MTNEIDYGFPANDPAKEERGISACIATRLLEIILAGTSAEEVLGEMNEIAEILIFPSQLRDLGIKYSTHEELSAHFKNRFHRNVYLHVVAHDSFEQLRRYTEWEIVLLSEIKPFEHQWRFADAFAKALVVSRAFIVRVSLSSVETVFTDDPAEAALANLLGYRTELING